MRYRLDASSAPPSASWSRSCSNPGPSSPYWPKASGSGFYLLHPAQLVELPLRHCHGPTAGAGAATPNIFLSRSTACFWISTRVFISLFPTPIGAGVGVAARSERIAHALLQLVLIQYTVYSSSASASFSSASFRLQALGHQYQGCRSRSKGGASGPRTSNCRAPGSSSSSSLQCEV
jgi:hypothetical protein